MDTEKVDIYLLNILHYINRKEIIFIYPRLRITLDFICPPQLKIKFSCTKGNIHYICKNVKPFFHSFIQPLVVPIELFPLSNYSFSYNGVY